MIRGLLLCTTILLSILIRDPLYCWIISLSRCHGIRLHKRCSSPTGVGSWPSLLFKRESQARSRHLARFYRMISGDDEDPTENIITSVQWMRKKARDMTRLATSVRYTQVRRLLETSERIWSGAVNHFRHLREKVPYADLFLTIGGTCLVLSVLRRGTRRFQTATDIPSSYFRAGNKRSLHGYVMSVNDSDNLRFYHRRLFSLPGRPKMERQSLKFETINVRLAGIDAPEIGHFGGVSQPYAEEAKRWLTKFVQNRAATILPHRLDQYSRLVATVFVRRWFFFKYNVSLEMVRAGYATVYRNSGAEYGDVKEKLIKAEARAQRHKKGMWKQSSTDYVSPAEYKKIQRTIGS